MKLIVSSLIDAYRIRAAVAHGLQALRRSGHVRWVNNTRYITIFSSSLSIYTDITHRSTKRLRTGLQIPASRAKPERQQNQRRPGDNR